MSDEKVEARVNASMLNELADVWDLQAETDTNGRPGRSETLRECADTLRMLVSVRRVAPTAPHKDCPHAAPFRYCPTCVVRPCPIGLGIARPDQRIGDADC